MPFNLYIRVLDNKLQTKGTQTKINLYYNAVCSANVWEKVLFFRAKKPPPPPQITDLKNAKIGLFRTV